MNWPLPSGTLTGAPPRRSSKRRPLGEGLHSRRNRMTVGGVVQRGLVLLGALLMIGGLSVPKASAQASYCYFGFSQSNYTVNEGQRSVRITMVRGGVSTGCAGRLEWATEDRSATHPADYIQGRGQEEFFPGTSSISFQIKIVDDDQSEKTETLAVRLNGETEGNVYVEFRDQTTVTIVDDDPWAPPTAESTGEGSSKQTEASSSPNQRPPASMADASSGDTSKSEGEPEHTPTAAESEESLRTNEVVTELDGDTGSWMPVLIVVVAVLLMGGIPGGVWWLKRRRA